MFGYYDLLQKVIVIKNTYNDTIHKIGLMGTIIALGIHECLVEFDDGEAHWLNYQDIEGVI